MGLTGAPMARFVSWIRTNTKVARYLVWEKMECSRSLRECVPSISAFQITNFSSYRQCATSGHFIKFQHESRSNTKYEERGMCAKAGRQHMHKPSNTSCEEKSRITCDVKAKHHLQLWKFQDSLDYRQIWGVGLFGHANTKVAQHQVRGENDNFWWRKKYW